MPYAARRIACGSAARRCWRRRRRALLDGIDAATQVGQRDRALIALMVYAFARIGAVLAMRVEDIFVQHRRL